MSVARFLISGHVQGVFFRASTRDAAQALGLDGYARNLDDGRVEVVARGSEEAIEALRAWLHQGPPQARVDRVERDSGTPDDVPAEGRFLVR